MFHKTSFQINIINIYSITISSQNQAELPWHYS
jgi:hypothetical protein